MLQLLQRIHCANVVRARRLVHVALKVLLAQAVVRTMIRPLEHAPECFQPVRVRHAIDPLADRVLDGFVLHPNHAFVGVRLIGVDRCAENLFRLCPCRRSCSV